MNRRDNDTSTSNRGSTLAKYEEQNRDTKNIQPTTSSPSTIWFSKRLLVSLVLFLRLMNYQIARNNINIAVVEMTMNKTFVESNMTIHRPDFNWDSATVGLVTSVFAYGGLLSFVGGFIANVLGGAVTCAICTMTSGILMLAYPVTLWYNFNCFLGLRFLTGLLEEFSFLSIAEIHSMWFPKKERSLFLSISYNGCNAGIALVYPVFGYLANSYGWEMVFYVTGAMSMLFATLIWIMVKNTPLQDKWISNEEQEYIRVNTDQIKSQKVSYPFKSIFFSGPVWSLFSILCAFYWVDTVIGACLPLYVKDCTHRGTNEVGLISAIPNLMYFFMFPLVGVLLHYWKNHSKISFTRIHKIIVGTAYFSTSVFFIIAAIASDFNLSMVLFVCTQILTSPSLIITEFITITLAPEHCNAIAALSMGFLSMSVLLPQWTTGIFRRYYGILGWSICFSLTAAVSAIGAILFVVFGSSETQWWSEIGRGRK